VKSPSKRRSSGGSKRRLKAKDRKLSKFCDQTGRLEL
jgi:hypothetical protein